MSNLERGYLRPEIDLFVREEIRRGISYSSYAYHGTSAVCLAQMPTTGVIPGRTTPDEPSYNFSPKRGDLYFYVNRPQEYPTEEAVWGAKSYANGTAPLHSFMSKLGLDLSNGDHYFAATAIIDNWDIHGAYRRMLLELGLGDDQIRKAKVEASKYRGVIVGLTPSVAKDFRVVDCRNGDEGWKAETGTGLPYTYVEGIRFLSPQDFDLYKKLIHL